MEDLTLLNRQTELREAYIEDALREMDDRLNNLSDKLYDAVSGYLLFDMDTDNDRVLMFSEYNINRLYDVQEAWDGFRSKYLVPLLLWMASSIVGQVSLSRKYFNAIGLNPKATNPMYGVLGVNSALTQITEGGYIDNLSYGPEVIREIKDYVLRSLGTGVKLSDFAQGLKQLIVGQVENPGVLKQYFNTYASDLWNQFQRITDNMMAEELGLRHFLYAGTLIAKSRKFCVERAGRVFTVEETVNWKCDPNLPGVHGGCDESYRPLIELGRWNCRHSVAWITESMYET